MHDRPSDTEILAFASEHEPTYDFADLPDLLLATLLTLLACCCVVLSLQ